MNASHGDVRPIASVDVDEIDLAAHFASRGPWVLKVTDGGTDIESKPTDEVVCTLLHGDKIDEMDEANLAYLRLVDPTTVRELVRLARIGLRVEEIGAQPLSHEASEEARRAEESWGSFDSWLAGQAHRSSDGSLKRAAEAGWNAAIGAARKITQAARIAETTMPGYAGFVDTELECLHTGGPDSI